MTKVVNCKTSKYDIYIGRPSQWGNPFVIGIDGTREEVIIKYEKHVRTSPILMRLLPNLAGKTLGCWCPPAPCHGDVLIKILKEMGYE
jgi:hypothetical protein